MVESVDYQPLSITQNSQNTQECFLQGSIFDQHVNQLHDRLRGLCDNVQPFSFIDHERTYFMKTMQQTVPIIVKASRAISKFPSTPGPWQLKYYGTIDSGSRNKAAMTRSVVTVACNKNPDDFLKELGFTLQYEVQLRGKLYRKGNIKIVVAKLMSKNFDDSKYENIAQSNLVEISAPATARDEKVSIELKNFAQNLRPIVHLDKIDPKRMLQAFQ